MTTPEHDAIIRMKGIIRNERNAQPNIQLRKNGPIVSEANSTYGGDFIGMEGNLSREKNKKERQRTNVIFGVLSLLLASAVMMSIATIVLSNTTFSVFISFVSVSSIIILAPNAALEQAVIKRDPDHQAKRIRLTKIEISTVLVVPVVILTLLVLNPSGLTDRLFGAENSFLTTMLLIAAPVTLHSSYKRGLSTHNSEFSRVNISHLLSALILVLSIPLLYLLGISPFHSLVVSQVISWALPGILLTVLRNESENDGSKSGSLHDEVTGHLSVFVFLNIIQVGLFFSGQLLLRLNSGRLGIDVLVQAQLLLSLSYVGCAITLGTYPVLLQASVSKTLPEYFATPILKIVGFQAVLIPIMSVVGLEVALKILRGAELVLSFHERLWFVLPSLSFSAAVVLMAALIALGKVGQTLSAWICGSAVLVSLTLFLSEPRISDISLILAGSAVTVPVLLLTSLFLLKWRNGKGSLGTHEEADSYCVVESC